MSLSSRSLVVFIVAVQALGACTRWVPVSYSALQTRQEEVRLETVRVTDRSGRHELIAHRVAPPIIEGWSSEREQELRLNIAPPTRLEVSRVNAGATVGLILGVVAGCGLAVLGGIALAFRNFR